MVINTYPTCIWKLSLNHNSQSSSVLVFYIYSPFYIEPTKPTKKSVFSFYFQETMAKFLLNNLLLPRLATFFFFFFSGNSMPFFFSVYVILHEHVSIKRQYGSFYQVLEKYLHNLTDRTILY